MLSRGIQLFLVVALIVFLVFLFHPEYIANAGSAPLKSVDGSNASGTAQLIPKESGGGSDFQVALQGLKNNFKYAVTLDKERCGGSSITTIGTVASDQGGNAMVTVGHNDLNANLQQGLWIDVRRGDASGPSVACGQLQLNSQQLAQFNTNQSSQVNPLSANTNNVTPTTSASSGTIWDNLLVGFPQTGADPGNSHSYDNYTYPRKR
jgi:hypothetical protein